MAPPLRRITVARKAKPVEAATAESYKTHTIRGALKRRASQVFSETSTEQSANPTKKQSRSYPDGLQKELAPNEAGKAPEEADFATFLDGAKLNTIYDKITKLSEDANQIHDIVRLTFERSHKKDAENKAALRTIDSNLDDIDGKFDDLATSEQAQEIVDKLEDVATGDTAQEIVDKLDEQDQRSEQMEGNIMDGLYEIAGTLFVKHNATESKLAAIEEVFFSKLKSLNSTLAEVTKSAEAHRENQDACLNARLLVIERQLQKLVNKSKASE